MAKKEKKQKKEAAEGAGKKKGKKKLLLIPIVLLLVAAVAAVVVLFVLPRFGGGEEGGKSEQEPPKKDGLEFYTVGEDSVASLDSILEEGEGALIANRGPGKTTEGSAGEVEKYTYIYEIETPAAVMNRYLDLLMSEEEGFVMTNEDYTEILERPELVDEEGAMLLVRDSVTEGHFFQLAIGWSKASDNLAVRVCTPEGTMKDLEEEMEPVEPASLDEQLQKFMSLEPSQLGLSGTSMNDYVVYAMEGFVKVDGIDCRRFTVYDRDDTGSISGIFMISTDQEHIYCLDLDTNAVTELR